MSRAACSNSAPTPKAWRLGSPFAEPLLLALNIISKILCFVAAIMLFVWREDGEVSQAIPARHAGTYATPGFDHALHNTHLITALKRSAAKVRQKIGARGHRVSTSPIECLNWPTLLAPRPKSRTMALVGLGIWRMSAE